MPNTVSPRTLRFRRHFTVVATIIFCAASFHRASAQDSSADKPITAKPTDVQTVRNFGALGDGQADDTAALQKAVNSRLGEIRFPRGDYRITQTLLIALDDVGPTSIVADGPARIVMEGPGPAIRFVGTHQGTASPGTVKDNVWKNQRSPMVDGLEIVGAHPQACGIEADGTMQLTLTRVVVRKALHGIHLVNRNRNVIISNCHLYENRGVGVFYDNVNLHQSNIIGSHISYNDLGGVVIRGGDVRNVHIGTCDIEGNMGDANSEPTANVLIDSTGGSIGEVAIVGCTIQHTHKAPHSANIRINGESIARKFTDETRHGNITIADNVLSDVQVNIDVTSTRGLTITGNTMWKGYTSNLRVDNSDSIVVSNNVFDRNPRYGYGDGADARLGLLFTRCNGCTISGNHIDQVGDVPAAIVVRKCRHFNITNSTILDCSPCGLWLDDVSFSRVSDCLIHESDPATDKPSSLRITGGKGNMIVDNLLGHDHEVNKVSAGRQSAQTLDVCIPVQLKYQLYLPPNYDSQEKWPLVLFLHGAGERGDDLELVNVHGPPKRIAGGHDFPFIVVSPQSPKKRWWQPNELIALLDDVEQKYRVDEDRVYCTGLSMGGFGTWSLAFYAPDRFAALAPICGGGETSWAEQFAHVPVWAFHGAKDTGVPLERSEEIIDELKKYESNAKLTVYPDAGHDSWTQTYDNPELYEWLLKQRRQPVKAKP